MRVIELYHQFLLIFIPDKKSEFQLTTQLNTVPLSCASNDFMAIVNMFAVGRYLRS